MKRFSDLYWKLDGTTSTNQKIEALKEYFQSAPPEDAACGLRVLCGAKQLRAVSARSLREWAAEFAEIPPISSNSTLSASKLKSSKIVENRRIRR